MTDTFDPDDPLEPFEPDDVFEPYEGLTDLTGTESLPTLEDPAVPPAIPPRSPLLTGLIVLLLLVVLSIAAFNFLSEDDPVDDATATSTTEVTGTDVAATTSGDGTPTTTTTADENGASTTLPSFEPYASQGTGLAIDDLKLAVDAIGPIALGSPADEAIGQLIASFGDPDDDTGPITSTGEFGACDGDTVRIIRFGALAAVVVIDPNGDETFAGYRVDLAYGGLDHPTANLETLSGTKPGNSIRQLERTYAAFDVSYGTSPEDSIGEFFELKSRNTGNLLLWGPVSSPDSEGFVRGIYAPDACGRFS